MFNMFQVPVVVCIALLSPLCEVKSTDVDNIYHQHGPIHLRTLKMMAEFTLLNISSLPDYCFEQEENSTMDYSYDDTFYSDYEQQSSSLPEVDDTSTEILNTTEVFDRNFTTNHTGIILSAEFLSCQLWIVEDGCYQILPNGSAYVPIYGRQYGISDHMITDGELLICPDKLTDPVPLKFSGTFDTISTIGLGISTACIIMHMIMFVVVKSLRNLPGYCLISLCMALVIGYSAFLSVQTMDREDDCWHIGMMIFYFFMASFFWMNILSYDVWRSLRMATSKLRLNRRIWLRFGVYSAYCWGSSGLVVMCAVIIDKLGDTPINYRLKFRTRTCWFEFRDALLVYFFMPFLILFILNFVFFIASFIMITSATMKTAENKTVLWGRFCVFLRLAIIMGLTWSFAVIASATDSLALWYFFVIFNTLQGVLIFFSFSCGQKTRKIWRTRIQKRINSTTPTSYSTQSQHFSSTSVPRSSQSPKIVSKV